jgi:hypothetical protein
MLWFSLYIIKIFKDFKNEIYSEEYIIRGFVTLVLLNERGHLHIVRILQQTTSFIYSSYDLRLDGWNLSKEPITLPHNRGRFRATLIHETLTGAARAISRNRPRLPKRGNCSAPLRSGFSARLSAGQWASKGQRERDR